MFVWEFLIGFQDVVCVCMEFLIGFQDVVCVCMGVPHWLSGCSVCWYVSSSFAIRM